MPHRKPRNDARLPYSGGDAGAAGPHHLNLLCRVVRVSRPLLHLMHHLFVYRLHCLKNTGRRDSAHHLKGGRSRNVVSYCFSMPARYASASFNSLTISCATAARHSLLALQKFPRVSRVYIIYTSLMKQLGTLISSMF